MNIGNRIRQRRRELGMTQEQLAKAVYVTPQAVSQWENERSVPDVYNISLIANALKMNKADLISEEEKRRPSWVVRDQFYGVENMYRKLKEFAKTDSLPEMDRAVDYAMEKHKGQRRKTSVFSEESVPYIVHPFIMACHAHALGIRDDAVLATVLLHDICEDCGIAPDELPFSPEVREAVRLLTRTEREDLDAYFSAIAANSTASIVKALDRCNNVSTMMLGFSTEGIIEYVDETQKYVIPLLDHIKKEYTQYYDAVFVLKYQILSVLESAKATILRM